MKPRSFSPPVWTEVGSIRCKVIGFELDFVPKFSYVGIDPGYNFGAAVLEGGKKHGMVWYGKLPEAEDRPTRAFLAEVFAFGLPRLDYGCAVIEGANYKATQGQVLLAEVRYSFWRGLHGICQERVIAAPSTIRKGVFGSGKVTAFDQWPVIDHNAADALGAAIYAHHLKEAT